MQRVLIIYRRESIYSLVGDASKHLMKEFQKRGICVDLLNISELNTEIYESLKRNRPDIVLTINGQEELLLGEEGESFYNRYRIPVVNWVLDHPASWNEQIRLPISDYYVFCLDRDHVSFVKSYYSNVREVFFVPLPGSGEFIKEEREEDYARRPIEVLFTGTHLKSELIEEEILAMPEAFRKISVDCIDYLLNHRYEPVEKGIKTVLQEKGMELSKDQLSVLCGKTIRSISNYIRCYVREELIRYLMEAGTPLHIVGNNWEGVWESQGKPNTTKLYGSIAYDQTMEVYRRTRILLNVMPWFKDGFHDRISAGLLNGTCVMTDTSGYIEEVYNCSGKHKELLLYDISHPEEVPEFIHQMLENPGELYRVSRAGYEKTSKKLDWGAIGGEIVQILNLILEEH